MYTSAERTRSPRWRTASKTNQTGSDFCTSSRSNWTNARCHRTRRFGETNALRPSPSVLESVYEADLDRSHGAGHCEVRRERAHGDRLLQRLPHLRDHEHPRRCHGRDRKCWLRRRQLHAASFSQTLVALCAASANADCRLSALHPCHFHGRFSCRGGTERRAGLSSRSCSRWRHDCSAKRTAGTARSDRHAGSLFRCGVLRTCSLAHDEGVASGRVESAVVRRTGDRPGRSVRTALALRRARQRRTECEHQAGRRWCCGSVLL